MTMNFRHVIGTMCLAVVTILIPQKTIAQNLATELVASGLRQLEEARTGFSDEAYQRAEDTFTSALGQDPNNPRALVHRGEAKMARVGILAAQAKFGTASEMAQSAMGDMDRAVSLAPNDLDVRLTRGFTYAAFPPYYNKAAMAREDLESATHHHEFANLGKEARSHALQALGIAYTNLSELEKALDSFRSAIDLAPDSRFGKDASERMKTLASSGVRPDRFPNISSDTSPLVVALSITFSGTYANLVQSRMQEISKAVAGFPGFLGGHLVASMDKPGMYIIFSWWKDKHAASEFYYSDLHQSWMSGRGQAFTGATTVPSPDAIPTQVSVEVFSGLPGGVQVNGGLIPPELFSGRGSTPVKPK